MKLKDRRTEGPIRRLKGEKRKDSLSTRKEKEKKAKGKKREKRNERNALEARMTSTDMNEMLLTHELEWKALASWVSICLHTAFTFTLLHTSPQSLGPKGEHM